MPIKKLADYFARPLVLPFLWALLASSVVCTALYIWVYGVNIPFWDEWIVIDMIRRHCDGLYKWPQIWGQHNEHRLVWPKIFFLSEYCLLGNHYPKACMFVCLGLLSAIMPFMLSALSATLPDTSRRLRLFLFIPIAWLLVSIRQFENLLWGFQVTFVSVAFFAVAVFWTLARFSSAENKAGRLLLFLAAVVLSILSSLSSAMGLFVWVAGCIMFLGSRGKRLLWAVSWLILAVAMWLVYFNGYQKPPNHPALANIFMQPLDVVYFFLATVGAPSGPIPAVAAFFGFFVCACLVIQLWRAIKANGRDSAQLFWLACAFFGLACAASITFGRAGFGVKQATSSRYITFTILPLITSYVFLVSEAIKVWRRGKHRRAAKLIGVVVCVFAASMFNGLLHGWHGGRSMRARNLDARDIVFRVESATDEEVSRVYPGVKQCRANVKFIKENGLVPFSK